MPGFSRGRLTNSTEALKKAIGCGLQLAVFNSCDGLGLARELEALHIPQMIVMQEPVPGETCWVLAWSMIGGAIAWCCGRRLYAVLAIGAATGVLYGVCLVILTQGGWVPVVPSALALVASGVSAIAYNELRSDAAQASGAHGQSAYISFFV